MEVLNPHSVLVTGSNRGIGLEIVRQLARKSNRPQWIFATCRDPESPRAQELKKLTAKHQGLVIVPMDVSDPSSVKAAAAQVTEQLKGAGLNLLINNAGIGIPGVLETVKPEHMTEVYQTNVVGPLMVSQEFLPLLKKASQESNQKGMSCSKAAIVNISSIMGTITNIIGWDFIQSVPYRCSKAALNMLTRCMSLRFAEDKILCIALHPGWVQTDMGTGVKSGPATVDGNVQEILSTLGQLSEKDTGTFVSWDRKPLAF
ncbi:C-signal-like [Tiliqua scincoides]|uniref:C-signal-like n=1 Tax=Tiliqua scincoides TaxID=71010 RepID=UPI0034618614